MQHYFFPTIVEVTTIILDDAAESSRLWIKTDTLDWDCEVAHNSFLWYYFVQNPIYDENMIWLQFQINCQPSVKVWWNIYYSYISSQPSLKVWWKCYITMTIIVLLFRFFCFCFVLFLCFWIRSYFFFTM